jgi:hypothetical protein
MMTAKPGLVSFPGTKSYCEDSKFLRWLIQLYPAVNAAIGWRLLFHRVDNCSNSNARPGSSAGGRVRYRKRVTYITDNRVQLLDRMWRMKKVQL